MRRKIWLLAVSCILCFCLCACGQSGSGGSDLPEDGAWSSGRYLKTKSSDMIIFERSSSPCVMTAADETVSFDDLTDGDRIQVYVWYLMETWPEQTTVYAVEKLEDGTISDIDSEILELLREYGWID